MATKVTILLMAAAVNINSVVHSSNEVNLNEGNCGWLLNTIDNSYNLHCPNLYKNVQINKEKDNLVIECKTPEKFDFTTFPKLDLYEVHNVELINCVVDENINFGSILEHFGVNYTKSFTIQNMKYSLQSLSFSNGFESLENLTLKLDENVFQSLKEVRELILQYNKITDLPQNIFVNLSNLESLLLSYNKIEILDERLFAHQKELNTLSLDGNEILDLPRIIFANLTNLENLGLSNNKLKNLDEGLFTHQQKLKKLALTGTVISYLPRNIFANLTNLKSLWLSKNKIQALEQGLFTHQQQLKHLYLTDNVISYLPRNIFANLTNLKSLWLSKNQIQALEQGLFTHQKKLKKLMLTGNEISYLPRNIFANLTSLVALHISRNEADFPVETKLTVNRIEVFSKNDSRLAYLPIDSRQKKLFLHRLKISNGFALPSSFELLTIKECEFEVTSSKNVSNNTALLLSGKQVNSLLANIFANQKKLKYLSLEMNELTELDDGLFNGLNKVKRLELSHNNLTSVSGLIFRELRNLNIILLDNNHIKSIDSDAFLNTIKLTKLDLSYNQLQYFDSIKSPFMYLDTLNLSNNYLTTLPSGWKDIRTLHLLDLGFNKISSYKYSDIHNRKNKIYYKEHYLLSSDELIEMKYEEDEYLSIFLNNITLQCDCRMLRFLLVRNERVINKFVNHLSEICEEKRLRCNETITSDSYDCPITEYVQCECTPNFENNIEMRCVRPITWDSPMSYLPIDPNKSLELYINKNIFTELPNLQNHVHVIIIQASYNQISDIKLENIPPNLRFLDVSHNKIKTISADVMDSLHNHKKLEGFLVGNNTWQCDCYTNHDKIIEFFNTISMTDFQDTNGQLPNGAVIELSSEAVKDYCAKEKYIEILTILVAFSTVIGIVVILIVILLYKYKKGLKIWLYAHNICLCCIGEDEFDKDKKFDAFISYTYHDEDVAVSILDELETGNPTYKICIHERDFVPGRLIQHSIAESMDNSCRTIIILSKNFLRSVWGLLEFRRAYESGLVERRMRLIIVINGDIGDSELLEPTMKSYLKTHTYIKWGDPYFWQKMRYALPHRNRNDASIHK